MCTQTMADQVIAEEQRFLADQKRLRQEADDKQRADFEAERTRHNEARIAHIELTRGKEAALRLRKTLESEQRNCALPSADERLKRAAQEQQEQHERQERGHLFRQCEQAYADHKESILTRLRGGYLVDVQAERQAFRQEWHDKLGALVEVVITAS